MDKKRRHDDDEKSKVKRFDKKEQLIEYILDMLKTSVSDTKDRPFVQGFAVIGGLGKDPVIFDLSEDMHDDTDNEEDALDEDIRRMIEGRAFPDDARYYAVPQEWSKPWIRGDIPGSEKYYPAASERFYTKLPEPFIDILQTGDKLYVLAEIVMDEECLVHLHSNTELEFKYVLAGALCSKYVKLPTKVDMGSISMVEKNGVLELSFDYLQVD